jgi:Uma2 family endonuclease
VAAPTVERLLTADEFQGLPDDPNGRKMELCDGRVVYMPHPGEEHADVAFKVVMALDGFVAPRELGKVRFDVGYVLRRSPDRVVSPDASFVAHGRLDPSRDRTKFFPIAPDLAIEVFSPTDLESEVADKVAEYLAAGSLRVWVVRPAVKTVTVHRRGEEPRVFGVGDTLSSDDAGFTVPGFALPVYDIFHP